MPTPTILLDNLTFPECPRWHDGSLYFSDVHAHRIIRVDASGAATTVLEDARPPAGLGWAPDGSLVFVRMVDRTLMRLDRGAVTTVAALSALEEVQLNDMTVDARGRAYIGAFGFDINAGQKPVMANIFLVQPDGAVSVAAREMRFPNGMVITPDGRTLIVAETIARCLTAFDIAADGSLSNRREWAALPTFPDGICLDAEGAVWAAAPITGECIRVREGGEVTDTIKVEGVDGKGVYACMLGGDDGRSLYLCTAKTSGPELVQGISTGWLETARVPIPHAGLP